MMTPMTPAEGLKVKVKIPDFVIESVNQILEDKLINGQCTFTQKDLMNLVLAKTTLTSQEIYDNHYFDFEEDYINLGWKVVYDKPGYNETYAATFAFTATKG